MPIGVLFLDGFDYGDSGHMAGVLTPFLAPCKYTPYSSITSASIVPGQGIGNALNFGNNGFHQQTLTKILPSAQAQLCFGANFLLQDFSAPGKPLFRYEAGGATLVNPGGFDDGTNQTVALFVEVLLDQTIQVCTGPLGMPGGTPNFPGTVLWNSGSAYSFPKNTWAYVELTVDTSAGSWSLAINDTVLQSQTGISILSGIDRVSIQSFGFENQWVDHLYLTDGARLGPCRVVGFPPILQSTHQWTPLSGTNLSQVSEFGNRSGLNTPDDNQSFVEATAAGVTDYYGFAAPLCFGRVLALALNVDGSAQIGSPAVDFLIKINGVVYSGGFSFAFAGGYTIQQAVSQLNPATNGYWEDADIGSGLFGFSFAGSGDLRVTQFMGEKLVSLRNYPFNCGGGPVSYTS